MKAQQGIAIVTRPTRLAGLLARHVTAGQARFVLKQAQAHELERRAKEHPGEDAAAALPAAAAEAEFAEYQREDEAYRRTLETLQRELDFDVPIRLVDREFLPTFDFRTCDAVAVVGQDGLVANTAKYVGDLPIVAVNPDPRQFDGILLPFQVQQARRAMARALEGKARIRPVTLAEVKLNDGQRLLAFNDFFMGAASHVSARYTLEVAGQSEPQSSSGVLVSTGAGSTGWFSSVLNMAQGVGAWLGAPPAQRFQLEWEDRRLLWAVREPFVSRHSRADLVAGLLEEGQELVAESLMPSGGVIFSDGVEADRLEFNSGVIARIGAAEQRARLVVE